MGARTDIGTPGHAGGTDWQGWQESWDRQQEWYLPDREERFRVMLDLVEALVGPEPRVLDLACGTGSITARVLRRMPKATTVGVDLDPALLTIARGSFDGDPRTRFVTADLGDPEWTRALPDGPPFDAVLTATALHWLNTEPLATLYGQLAGVVREGGVFLNADHMPENSTPRIDEAFGRWESAQRERKRAAGVQSWSDWWATVAADPVLKDVAAERFGILGNPIQVKNDHNNEDFQSPDWHARTLLAAGFAEARPVWRSPSDALVLGLR